jgi:hypothetical protein
MNTVVHVHKGPVVCYRLYYGFFTVSIIVYSDQFRNKKISEALKDSAMLADGLISRKNGCRCQQLTLTLAQLRHKEIKHPGCSGFEESPQFKPEVFNIFIADRGGSVGLRCTGQGYKRIRRKYFTKASPPAVFRQGNIR